MTPEESFFGALPGAGIVFVLAVVNVTMLTVRVTLTARGRAKAASTIAGFESALFVIVFSRVIGSLTSPMSITAYALGVGAGTYCGVVIDRVLRNGRTVHSTAGLLQPRVNGPAAARVPAATSPAILTPQVGRRAARQQAYLHRR